MCASITAYPGRRVGASHPVERPACDVAPRRAWWSLLLYPVAFVAAFVVGEGLFTLLADGVGDPAFWVVVVSAAPAALVVVVPGALAAVQGRRAMRLGRLEGRVPATIGAAIGVGFVGLNVVSYVVQAFLG